MTRSIFDPNSGETERSGSQNLGADADQSSQLPPDITDELIVDDSDAEEEDAVMDMPSAEEIMHPTDPSAQTSAEPDDSTPPVK